jgi:hypothetical protein
MGFTASQWSQGTLVMNIPLRTIPSAFWASGLFLRGNNQRLKRMQMDLFLHLWAGGRGVGGRRERSYQSHGHLDKLLMPRYDKLRGTE